MNELTAKFDDWLDTFVQEKQFDTEQILEVEGDSGTNFIPLQILLDTIKTTSTNEQKKIKDMLVRIDFHNGDCIHFFKHLAQAIST